MLRISNLNGENEENYMHGGGPSPSGSNLRHSYGLAAVSKAQTSAKGRFPEKLHAPYYQITKL